MLIIVAIVMVALYAAAVALYAASGDVVTVGSPGAAPNGGLLVRMSAQSVSAASQRISMDLTLETSPQLTAENGAGPNRAINLVVAPTGGSQSIIFSKNEVPSTIPITIIADGEIENWPFDRYTAATVRVVGCAVDCATGKTLPTHVYLDGHVPGWTITGHENSDGETIYISAARSGSTIAFGLVLLALMVVMPCLVLFVGITTLVRGRKVEASFMSWMAAMLFATIPLRTFLPGSPPIGSWIDFTVVLWVIVALVAGLLIYVISWSREHRAREYSAREYRN